MNAEVPGLITGGCNHSPLTGAADGDRFAAQFGIVPLLYTGIEC
jgi:hypothetical protein